MTNPSPIVLRLLTVAALIQVVLLLTFAGLLGGATWRPDEYDTLARYHQEGISFLWHRISRWSPRPFSELLIYFYATVVNSTHLQLIPLVMGLMWGGMLFSIGLIAVWFRHLAVSVSARLLPVLLPVVLTLSSAKTGEVFYWPFGSMAYMPTVSALLVMLAILIWGHIRSHALSWSICGVILASSSEMGAFFLLFLSGFLGVACIRRATPTAFAALEWLKPLIPSILIALWVMVGLAMGRFGNSDEAQMGSHVSHNLVAVLGATIPEATWQLLGKATLNGWDVWPYALIKLCLALCVYSLISVLIPSNPKRPLLVAFGLACVATVGFTVFAAFYQFGVSCCERHDTVRHFLSFLAITAFAVAAASYSDNQSTARLLSLMSAATALLLTLLAAIASALKVWPDYQNYASITQLRKHNWLFNQEAPFVFLIEEHHRRAWGTLPTPTDGHFSLTDNQAPIFNNSVIRFFGVESVEFERKRNLLAQLPINQVPTSIITPSAWINMACTTDQFHAKHFTEGKSPFVATQLEVAGWLNLPETGLDLARTSLLLHVRGSSAGNDAYFSLNLSDRPDVAQHFQRKDLLLSGFTTKVRIPFQQINEVGIKATDGVRSANCQLRVP